MASTNQQMTREQLDELMVVAVRMQRDAEKLDERPVAVFAYAVQLVLAELQNTRQQLAAVVAELGAIEAIHNDAVFITDEHYEQCPPEAQKIIGALAVLKIPAYDAHLAELRAQGVEMFASHLRTNDNGASVCKMIALGADEFAAQLRQGAEHE